MSQFNYDKKKQQIGRYTLLYVLKDTSFYSTLRYFHIECENNT